MSTRSLAAILAVFAVMPTAFLIPLPSHAAEACRPDSLGLVTVLGFGLACLALALELLRRAER